MVCQRLVGRKSLIRQLHSLFRRYRAAHVNFQVGGVRINGDGGATIGFIERITFDAGWFRVTGWAHAQKLTFSLNGVDVDCIPTQSRPDAAQVYGVPEKTGFKCVIPGSFDDLEMSSVLVAHVFGDPGLSTAAAMQVPLRIRRLEQVLVAYRFARDLGLSLPGVAGWYLTGDPKYRARVKRQLRLSQPRNYGALLPDMFDAVQDQPAPTTGNRITIILPVYNAYDLLQECLQRVIAHTDLPWQMILVEDRSTNDSVLPFLRGWVEDKPNVTLLENAKNLGFVASVNRGLSLALETTEGDTGPVVLLNSDALVPKRWASRLVEPFELEKDVASVTPLSNDAEIFSVPVICQRVPLKPGQGDIIDATARQFRPGAEMSDVPTGVGFCMAMARDWLVRVPSFDPAFGRGYGEEVDWCQKVSDMGGRHVVQPRLFVEHRGGESFGASGKATLIAQNNEKISQRYPDYDKSVQDFIALDPLVSARLALGLAWAGSLQPDSPVPVYMAHTMGGGADHYLERRIAQDLEAGRPSVVLRVGGPFHRWQLELVTTGGRHHGVCDRFATVQRLLSVLPRRHVVYSCGVGDEDPVTLPQALLDLMHGQDTAEMLFHDYFPLTPSYNLLDSDGAYRGPVVHPRGDSAHQIRSATGETIPLDRWQAAWKRFAAKAKLTVFSKDSAQQVAAVWPDLKAAIQIEPHALSVGFEALPPRPANARPTIGVLGNIGQSKGAAVVQDMAKRLGRDRDRVCDMVVVGNVDPAFALPGDLRVHGSYAVSDLPILAERYGITHWLVPSIWPETFCYTVHEAIQTGLPVLAFEIGAQGEAVRAAKNGHEIPFDPDADLAHTAIQKIAYLVKDEKAGVV
ncbi:glycosyltransferase [Roseovarius gahaiensis]|uniref:Glycosyltransferase n=1 Tax=Roseovarius gahaiensis TaxID=2716691 RepID=A0A967BIT4_9RHOB|nr:glycosyltransferase [Roseovarius gahaiensis]